jgi:hypothetical protein
MERQLLATSCQLLAKIVYVSADMDISSHINLREKINF